MVQIVSRKLPLNRFAKLPRSKMRRRMSVAGKPEVLRMRLPLRYVLDASRRRSVLGISSSDHNESDFRRQRRLNSVEGIEMIGANATSLFIQC